eukprot:CAMPEP_0183313872 /NCGR_PEP_ID=MMETSP0160_2-20130417/46837_1 /TAXON_ID=2839 ORGANISM="Odontella Sinensis, Strain Grunow 1884" /NCGR_SAMPLE_ID=MMETSP0160_2 /ASSEMBLY_ACC=CAM_ASM_000250 /LENGTH=71 /DNA_ID=CAMNT_0025479053 /DNA_START=9 /DNA_END=220 /DNA_ORIENTATION=+
MAHCGGGGSARTGVSNSIAVTVKEQIGADDYSVRRIRVDTGDQIGVGVAIYRRHDGRGDARMLAAVGDEAR